MKPRPVSWRPRDPPLEVAALVVPDEALDRLRSTLARRAPECRNRLRGLRFSGGIVLLGRAEHLPWVRGARYLGRHPLAGQLLVPTDLEPDVPLDLFERALRRWLGAPEGTLAVLPQQGLAVPVERAGRLVSGLP